MFDLVGHDVPDAVAGEDEELVPVVAGVHGHVGEAGDLGGLGGAPRVLELKVSEGPRHRQLAVHALHRDEP